MSLNLKNIETTLRHHLSVKRHICHMPGPYVAGVQEAAQALMDIFRMERQCWRLNERQHWDLAKRRHFDLCDHAHAQFGTLDEQFRAADRTYAEAVKRYDTDGPLYEDISAMSEAKETADAAD